MKALNDAKWHSDYSKIEQTIGYLDGDKKVLYVVALSWYQRVEL